MPSDTVSDHMTSVSDHMMPVGDHVMPFSDHVTPIMNTVTKAGVSSPPATTSRLTSQLGKVVMLQCYTAMIL